MGDVSGRIGTVRVVPDWTARLEDDGNRLGFSGVLACKSRRSGGQPLLSRCATLALWAVTVPDQSLLAALPRAAKHDSELSLCIHGASI